MNEFATAMSDVWDTSRRVFGETCTIGTTVIDCIIHALNYADGVDAGRAGRSATVGGLVIVKRQAWIDVGGKKGTNIVFAFGTFRVLNDPEVGYDTSEIVLNIGPLT